MEKKTTLQTVDRALSFLEFVACQEAPPSINEVAEGLKLNITTSYHLLRTLQSRGYIKKDSFGGLILGESVKVLFDSYQHALRTEEKISSVVKRVTTATNETAFLSLLEGGKVVLKSLIEGSQRLRVGGLYVGLQGHEYSRASGKAVLAFLSEKDKHEMLKVNLAHFDDKERKKKLKEIEKELIKIKEKGWSLDDQTEQGFMAIGAPIFDGNNIVIGAIGLIAPSLRAEPAFESYLNTVLAASSEATQILSQT